jgi:hypothetical protein
MQEILENHLSPSRTEHGIVKEILQEMATMGTHLSDKICFMISMAVNIIIAK